MDLLNNAVPFPDIPEESSNIKYTAYCDCGARTTVDGCSNNGVKFCSICPKCGGHIDTFEFRRIK